MKSIDDVIERYGDSANLEDAVLIYEVSYPDPEREGERLADMGANTTTQRATVAGGMAQAYATIQLTGWERDDE